MKSWLILRHITVENANAIAGLTYGFPSITHFLGYTHKLSRQITDKFPKLHFVGCGVISHEYKLHTIRGQQQDHIFILKRHPLRGAKAEAPSEIQEGRVHMDISLVIECSFDESDIENAGFSAYPNAKQFENFIKNLAVRNPLAGGFIKDIKNIEWSSQSDHLQKSLVPGFALISAQKEFEEYINSQEDKNLQTDMMQGLLDCIAIKRKYVVDENEYGAWERQSNPITGWCVPIMIGNRAISTIYPPGKINKTRDPSVPFRYVEPIYALGKWVSPLRVGSIDKLIWRYKYEDPFYLCHNDQ